MHNKKIISLMLTAMILLTSSCNQALKQDSEYKKYQATFIELFDTYSEIIGYAKTEEEFNVYSKIIFDKMKKLNDEYDIYHDYAGVNNIKMINDNAGKAPVAVSDDIIDLLMFSKKAYEDTEGRVNVALGPILRIWHDYREAGMEDLQSAKLPPMEDLKEASKHCDIDKLIIDKENKTVFLEEEGMSLDVGAIAKGYATQRAVDAAREAGMQSALVSIGGNICSVGRPFDGVRERWSVGIQDPQKQVGDKQNVLDVVFTNDATIVTSGSYQRYYEVDGQIYSHIIDPDTLMPPQNYAGVTIVTKDSGIADMLSTALYLLPIEEGKKILQKFNSDAIWVKLDGSLEYTDGYKKISKNIGGYKATTIE